MRNRQNYPTNNNLMYYRYRGKRRTGRKRRMRTGVRVRPRGYTPHFKNRKLISISNRMVARNIANRRQTVGITPEKFYRCLPYFEVITLSFATTNYSTWQFDLNNLNDPNKTGTGHQPRGLDQLATLYKNYRVYAAVVSVDFTYKESQAGTGDQFYVALIGMADTGTCPVTLADLHELPGGVASIGFLTHEKPKVTLRRFFKMHQIEGVDRSEYNNLDEYQSSIGSGPITRPKCFIAGFTHDASGTSLSISAHVTITFYTEFYRPQEVGES